MKRVFLYLFIVTACETTPSEVSTTPGNRPKPLPRGWRHLMPLENSQCDRSKDWLFQVNGDFDGDLLDDEVKLLVKEDGQDIGLWIWQSNGYPPTLIEQIHAQDRQHDMALAVIVPQKIKTACGAGRWKCKRGETALLDLTTPGIKLYTCKGAGRVFYYDEPSSSFKQEWLPDEGTRTETGEEDN